MPAKLTDEQIDAFLDTKPGWIVLTSIDAKGYPHSVPLGYFRDGDKIYCGVRDNTQKIRNIERNPKVSLLIESGATMQNIKGAMVQGTATIRRDPDSVLALMRAGATQRGIAAENLPTTANPGSAFIEISPVRKISWDYGAA
ncbi:MAG: pyridoxamine 5'-phosphate oxidase family protein [Pseudomonadota bacterium]